MMRLALVLVTGSVGFCPAAPRSAEASILVNRAWINEFHYDNAGADVDEFVEVVLPDWFSATGDVRVSLYNGGTGQVYDGPLGLDTFTAGVSAGGLRVYWRFVSMQNGPRDGLALEHAGALLQFLSYEGVFTAVDGIAAGVTSVDVGVSESPSTPIGKSLGLSGTGDRYTDFSWNGPADASRGLVNHNQVFRSSASAVPEASSLVAWLALAGIAALGAVGRRSRRKSGSSFIGLPMPVPRDKS